MNPLKALNLYKRNLLSHKSISQLFRIFLSLRERKGEVTLKMFSFRLNIKPYNRLSKETEDFRDL